MEIFGKPYTTRKRNHRFSKLPKFVVDENTGEKYIDIQTAIELTGSYRQYIDKKLNQNDFRYTKIQKRSYINENDVLKWADDLKYIRMYRRKI